MRSKFLITSIGTPLGTSFCDTDTNGEDRITIKRVSNLILCIIVNRLLFEFVKLQKKQDINEISLHFIIFCTFVHCKKEFINTIKKT